MNENNTIELHEMMSYLQDRLLEKGMIATEDELHVVVVSFMQFFVEKGIFEDIVYTDEEE